MRHELIDLPATMPRPTRPFFAKASGREFKARTSAAGVTVIDIFDEIGPFGTDTGDVEKELHGAGDVVVRLSSPGGDVWAGLAIFNLLAAHAGDVRVEVIGVAASAASLIAMAADTIAIADNAFLHVHRAWTLAMGNESDMDETAALLRQVDSSMASTYASRTGQPLATVRQLMQVESWFDANTAIELGFADETIEAATPRARFDLSVYAKAPAQLTAPIERGEPTIRDVERALQGSGMSKSQARAIASRGFHGNQDEQRDAAAIAELAAHIQAAAHSIN